MFSWFQLQQLFQSYFRHLTKKPLWLLDNGTGSAKFVTHFQVSAYKNTSSLGLVLYKMCLINWIMSGALAGVCLAVLNSCLILLSSAVTCVPWLCVCLQVCELLALIFSVGACLTSSSLSLVPLLVSVQTFAVKPAPDSIFLILCFHFVQSEGHSLSCANYSSGFQSLQSSSFINRTDILKCTAFLKLSLKWQTELGRYSYSTAPSDRLTHWNQAAVCISESQLYLTKSTNSSANKWRFCLFVSFIEPVK